MDWRKQATFLPHGPNFFCVFCKQLQDYNRGECSRHKKFMGLLPKIRVNISGKSSSYWSCIYSLLILSSSFFTEPVDCNPTFYKDSDEVDISQLRPKWINPCGYKRFHHASRLPPNFPVLPPPSQSRMLTNIINTATKALQHSVRFKSEYVKKTFSVNNWKDHHELWRDQKLSWLPSWEDIPKHLNERINSKHPMKVEVKGALKKIYAYLQKIAVGLEQIVIDKLINEGDNEEFLYKFNEAEYQLKSVLCEIQGALIEMNIYEDLIEVSRNVMPSYWRQMPSSHNRDLRDWLIYRDYMNSLEYIIQTFDHLAKKA